MQYMNKTTRPDMRDYFASQIDRHVNGMMAGHMASIPRDVARIDGTVTDPTITVTMRDGTSFQWSGGKYASRRVNLCYAPLMPKPVKA